MPASPFEQRNPFDARHPALEAAIEATDELDSYRVLADWLIGRGDPRGDLVMLQLAEELDPSPSRAAAVSEIYERYKEYFLGPLGRHVTVQDNSSAPAFHWRRGFIHRAKLSQLKYSRFTGTVGEALAALLDHASARFLRTLSLGFNTPERDHQVPIDALVARAPRALRALYLGPGADPDVDAHGVWRDLGDLSRLWPALPKLETLIVAGQSYTLGDLALPALAHLELRGPAADPAALAATGHAAWPSLRRLVVWLGTLAPTALQDLLAPLDAPRLEHLGLVHSRHADDLAAFLCTQPSMAGVRSLDLSRGNLSDAGAEALARGLARFPRLEHLDVSHSYLTEQGTTLLASVVPALSAGGQREPATEHDDRDLFDY